MTNLVFTSKSWVFILPLILIAADCVLGFASAALKKKIKPSKMREGLHKKFSEIIVLFLAGILSKALVFPAIVTNSVSIYICAMEFTSILKKAADSGLNLPSAFTNLFDNESK